MSDIPDIVKHRFANTSRQQFEKELPAIEASINKMSDGTLSAWQSQFKKDTPQFILAEQKMKYRITNRAAILSAVITLSSSIAGIGFGWWLKSTERPENVALNKPNCESNKANQPPITQEKASPLTLK